MYENMNEKKEDAVYDEKCIKEIGSKKEDTKWFNGYKILTYKTCRIE